jgi:Kae1-associated kinase Bud32
MQEKGAEAVLTFSETSVHKERIAKAYRHPELDEKLRKLRNRKEAKILAEAPVRVPKLISSDDYSITMERINGPRLRDVLTVENAAEFGSQLGSMLSLLHEKDIIHGDLTTSNILVDNGQLVLIDFGLAVHSPRREDRAVDLHVLRETLEGTHQKEKNVFWTALADAYTNKEALTLLEEVETRGRYKEKY